MKNQNDNINKEKREVTMRWVRRILYLTLVAVPVIYFLLFYKATEVDGFVETRKLLDCTSVSTSSHCEDDTIRKNDVFVKIAREFALNERDIFILSHEREAFAGQLATTRLVVRLITIITIIGMGMVLIEFIISIWRGREYENIALEVGPKGLSMRTPFIGFLMVGFALAFLIAFLQYAYDIDRVGNEPLPKAASTQEPST